jgi:hypothetical protein
VEGTKTPAGNSGRAETLQRDSARRLNFAPLKAKCLERKSTAPFNNKNSSKNFPIYLKKKFAQKFIETLLIGVEGTKTPAGNSGRAETPQRVSVRRLSAAPRKAKCLERKSTAPITKQKYFKRSSTFSEREVCP